MLIAVGIRRSLSRVAVLALASLSAVAYADTHAEAPLGLCPSSIEAIRYPQPGYTAHGTVRVYRRVPEQLEYG
jgi:hypothetical protein